MSQEKIDKIGILRVPKEKYKNNCRELVSNNAIQ